MNLTERLISRLHRVFNKDPKAATVATLNFDNRIAEGQTGFIQIEEESENLLLQSNDLDQAPWAAGGTGGSMVQDAVAPDGTVKAWTLTDSASDDYPYYRTQPVTVLSGLDYTFSCYLRKRDTLSGSGGFCVQLLGGLETISIIVNPVTGTWVVQSGMSAPVGVKVRPVGAFWRAEISVITDEAQTEIDSRVYFLVNADASATPDPTAEGSNVACWFQLEQKDHATSYKPTTDATAVGPAIYDMAGIVIRDRVLKGSGWNIDLTTVTLQQLEYLLNAKSSVVLSAVPDVYADLPAWGVLDIAPQPLSRTLALLYPTSLLYNEMQTYSRAMDDPPGRLKSAEDQLYMPTATGSWLRDWGSRFGIPAFDDEADAAYAERIKHEILRATQNNVALSLIIRDALGVEAQMLDAEPHVDLVPPAQQGDVVGRFLLDMGIPDELTPEEAQLLIDRVKALVRRYKAAGTDFLETALRKMVAESETVSLAEVLATTVTILLADGPSPGPIKVGAGWKVGTPGLKVGNNDAIKEQIFVQTLDAGTSEAVASHLYGG